MVRDRVNEGLVEVVNHQGLGSSRTLVARSGRVENGGGETNETHFSNRALHVGTT